VSDPIQRGFEYTVKLAVSIPLAWADLLKLAAKHHYDWKCREAGECGVVNGLYNTAQGGPLESTYAMTARELGLVGKVAEQIHHHTKDHMLVLRIRAWLQDTSEAIEKQWELCMQLPGSAER